MSKTYQLNECGHTRGFQTVGVAAQNTSTATDVVAGCCCRRRAEVERRVL